MLAIVAGRVPPPAMRVQCARLLSVEVQMPVGFIHGSATALLFEVVDNVGKSFAIEQVFLNGKREGADIALAGPAREIVAALVAKGIEVERPEIPVPPFADRAGMRGMHCEDLPLVP